MKFKYRKIDLPHPFSPKKYLLRPIIPIGLRSKDSSLRYEALIDSGSDFCIFPLEIAQKLNIDLPRNRRIHFTGIERSSVEGVICDVHLNIDSIGAKTKVVFAQLSDVTGILGQNGFFDLFTVKFDLPKEEIELKPKSPKK